MKVWSLAFGYFCVNMGIWTIAAAGLLIYSGQPSITDPTAMQNLFSLDLFTGVATALGGGIITVLAIMTKSYAMGTGAILLWVVGMILKPLQDIVIGLPKLVGSLLPPEVSFFVPVISAFAALALFMFVVGILTGRDLWE